MTTHGITLEELKKLCPSWVNWIAQDHDGAWWGFEHEPNEGDGCWYENEVGKYVKLAQDTINPDWQKSLIRYPPHRTPDAI